MKITEIVDTQFRNTKFPAVHQSEPITSISIDPKSIGQGYYSTVKQTPNNPHEVYKSTNRSFNHDDSPDYTPEDTADAFYDWAKAIAPYAKSNPYLPRIYVVDTKTDVLGKIKPRYQMEKLKDFFKLPIDVLYALYYKEVPNPDDEYINKIGLSDNPKLAKMELWRLILDNVIKNTTDNPNIMQAIEIIGKLINQHGFMSDTHYGNFMIRLTSIGPQIVFTDPVATV